MTPPLLGVIPARLGSSRLPNKPLLRLAGRPLIEWVWRRARSSRLFDALVVATDSEEVRAAVEGFGGEARLTAPDHPSGTDRVAEVATRPEYRSYSVIVNVQGDEPFVRAEHLRAAAEKVSVGEFGVGTLACRVEDALEWRDPASVKVVLDDAGRALYFTRAPVPWPRDEGVVAPPITSGCYLRHVGVYSYRAESLARWVSLPPHPLECIERLEQLRPLAAGIAIGVAVVTPTDRGVDTPEDARRAERRLRNQPAGQP